MLSLNNVYIFEQWLRLNIFSFFLYPSPNCLYLNTSLHGLIFIYIDAVQPAQPNKRLAASWKSRRPVARFRFLQIFCVFSLFVEGFAVAVAEHKAEWSHNLLNGRLRRWTTIRRHIIILCFIILYKQLIGIMIINTKHYAILFIFITFQQCSYRRLSDHVSVIAIFRHVPRYYIPRYIIFHYRLNTQPFHCSSVYRWNSSSADFTWPSRRAVSRQLIYTIATIFR